MRRKLIAAGVVGAVCLAVWGAGVGGSRSPTARLDNGVVALVDGRPITTRDFDAYALVFTDPSGRLSVSREDVLLSLINQSLALAEAESRGLTVTQDEVEATVRSARQAGLNVALMAREGGLDAFRARTRTRLLFERVKAAATSNVVANDDQVRAYFATHGPVFGDQPFEQVKPWIRDRVTQQLVDAAWSGWLAEDRACSRIDVLDPTLSAPDVGPLTECPPRSRSGASAQ